MLPKDTQIYASYHPDDKSIVLHALEQIKAAGWENIVSKENNAENTAISELIQQSGMFVVFLSKTYFTTIYCINTPLNNVERVTRIFYSLIPVHPVNLPDSTHPNPKLPFSPIPDSYITFNNSLSASHLF